MIDFQIKSDFQRPNKIGNWKFKLENSRRETAGLGFTLIEIIVAIAIAGLLAALAVEGLGSLRDWAALGQAIDQALEALSEARSRTLASDNARSYGVHFESDRVILFPGPAYSPDHPENKTIPLPATIKISSIALSTTTASAVFERLTGQSPATGTVTFRSDRSAKSRDIEIMTSGMAVSR